MCMLPHANVCISGTFSTMLKVSLYGFISLFCNLKNIIWYSTYESSKTGNCNTFLVSFIIPLSWPQEYRFWFDTRCKILLKITHQTMLREALTFFEVGLRKFALASELFVPRPYFIPHKKINLFKPRKNGIL